MSDASKKPAHADPASLLAIAIGALVIAGIVYLSAQARQASLHRSQVGFAGLENWLDGNDIETLTFTGGGALRPDDIGLRILPLFDADLLSWDDDDPKTGAEILQQKTEFNIVRRIVNEKLTVAPTLVILPKWRRAVRTKGIAHPAFLIPRDDVERVQKQIANVTGSLVRPSDTYAETSVVYDGKSFDVGLYQPQFTKQSGCQPILGEDNAMLLGKCEYEDSEFWLLSDPDLLNAHGLKLGENARLARQVVADLAGDSRVIIDLTSAIFITEYTEPKRRSWSELGRFFAFPFSTIWIGFALLSALFLWRAWVRYGPIIRLFEDQPRASKTNSIDATARLLRLSGHDRELLQSHIAARCRILATDLLGPHRNPGTEPVGELVRIVARKSPELSQKLTRASSALQNENTDLSEAELLRRLDEFETLCERILHEFGRSSDARSIHQG